MRRFLARTLRSQGFEPVFAYYEPYSLSPQMSVPTWRLLQRCPTTEQRQSPDGCESYAIGAWLPEFEFTNYLRDRGLEAADGRLRCSSCSRGQRTCRQRLTIKPAGLFWHGSRRDGWTIERTA